jgi:hypothetical protein
MKKSLLLPILAVAFFGAQAGAAEMCLWPSGDCWPVGDERDNCSRNGWIFDGGTQGEGTACSGGTFTGTGKDQNPPTGSATSLGCCKWDTETKCWDVFDSEAVSDCSGGDNQFWSSACPDKQGTCPGGAPNPGTSSGSGGGGSGNFCNYGTCVGGDGYGCAEGGCYPVDGSCTGGTLVEVCPAGTLPPKIEEQGGYPTGTVEYCRWSDPDSCWPLAAADRSECEQYGSIYTDVPKSGEGEGKRCEGGTWIGGKDPNQSSSIRQLSLSVTSNIIKAIHNGINLQLMGSAKVQVYDLKGNLVRSLELAKGSYNVQFSDMARGTYIVRVAGGAWKQTVAVPVK